MIKTLLALILAAVATAAYAGCFTNTVITPDGTVLICTTCCENGMCTTNCTQ